ncbi:MAG TPA: hypothetical protein VI913_00385 [Candidatus Peribacteraceae bacterium]|nr:hypothetical protein [Candidatus Peribacteraceae bacterium]
MDFNLEATTAETKGRSDWTVCIDGRTEPVSHIACTSKYGTLEWGKRPEGFTGWVWNEAGGGGAITIPYSYRPDSELLVGLIEENRLNMGGLRWCAIGGFAELPATHAETQVKEARDEAGIDSRQTFPLGIPQISNRLYFVGDPTKDEGVHAYALEVPFAQLDQNMQIPEAEGKLGKATFHHWRKAVLEICGDVLATAAVAQLVAKLEEDKLQMIADT